ncbi:hypothetical protein Bbelb_431680 [Branchiostoma belcheri]|nr:hypothetical protein Bbelb_431680 [Branchiostoma belcheri]
MTQRSTGGPTWHTGSNYLLAHEALEGFAWTKGFGWIMVADKYGFSRNLSPNKRRTLGHPGLPVRRANSNTTTRPPVTLTSVPGPAACLCRYCGSVGPSGAGRGTWSAGSPANLEQRTGVECRQPRPTARGRGKRVSRGPVNPRRSSAHTWKAPGF